MSSKNTNSKIYNGQDYQKLGIAFLGVQRNMVHLVLAALGAVAVETQGLVGQQLVGAGVDGSTDGNTAVVSLALRRVPNSGGRLPKKQKPMLMSLRKGAGQVRWKRTQEQHLDSKRLLDIFPFHENQTRKHTEGEQLWGDLLELTQTLRDGVGWRSLVSAIVHHGKYLDGLNASMAPYESRERCGGGIPL